jgi:ElaB/YqjD/DUF883 family membrane-anchored ribosome-binding protein
MPMAEPVYPNDETRRTVREAAAPMGTVETAPGPSLAAPDRELPPPSRLDSAAERVGSAVGSAFEQVKQLPNHLQEIKGRLIVMGRRTREDAARGAREISRELQLNARVKAREARTRARFYAHEYPLETIAAVAGLGFVLGVILRLWRDHAE